MHKPIYLPQDLCQQLQSKGLECGSGHGYIYNPHLVGKNKYSEWMLVSGCSEDDGVPAFELHIDILGSRENLEIIFGTEQHYYKEEISDFVCEGKCGQPNDFDNCVQARAHEMIDLLLEGNPDQAINLIKEAV